MNTTDIANIGEARDMLQDSIADMLGLADQWEIVARSAPREYPFIKSTALHMRMEAQRQARLLAEVFRGVSLGRVDLTTAASYVEAARIQYGEQTTARRVMGRVLA